MHHRTKGRKLERNRNGRRALVRSLVESLVVHGRIQTTEAKAKEIKSRIDRIVNTAKNALVAESRVSTLRLLKSRVSLPTLERFSDNAFVERFNKRTSGYARVVKLSPRRGDGARMAVLEFVD